MKGIVDENLTLDAYVFYEKGQRKITLKKFDEKFRLNG